LSPDFRRGRGMSRGKQSQAFMKALKREAEANGGENIFTEQQVQYARVFFLVLSTWLHIISFIRISICIVY
jgi:hypothetical protein